MKKNLHLPVISFWLAFVFLLVSALWAVTCAAPMPPRQVINHQTQQCADIVPGDECGDVILPPDWEYLDLTAGEKCPDNFTFVELRPDWVHFKVPFCCTEGHSGSSGDCQDVVIQPVKRQCAFVDDIQKCTGLPDGWEVSGQNCPAGFEWVEDVVCTGEEAIQTAIPTTSPLIETTSPAQPAGSPTPTQTGTTVHNPLLPCFSLGLTLVALISLRFRRL
jgi:hypothetical protein